MSEQPVSDESKKGNSSLIWALLLIGIGGYWLADNVGLLSFWENLYIPVNLWALFLVIPGAILLGKNLQRARQGESEDRDVRNRIAIGGLMLLFGAYWFMGSLLSFHIDGDWLVPAALIVVGLVFLLRRPAPAPRIDA